MANNTSKTFDLSASGSTVLKFNGHPGYDAFRVDVEGGSGNANVNVYVSKDDELDNVTTGSAALVDSTTGVGSGSSFGSEVSARTVLVEITEGSTSDPIDGTVYGHNASDPAENGAAFANR